MVSSVNNYNRISGLATGLDTDTMVEQMVKAQSTKLFKLQQSKTLNSWKTDSYREINTKLDDFRKSVEGLRLQSTFNKKTITSSQPDAMGASISGVPTSSTYTISYAELPKPAQGASVSLTVPGGRATKADGDFTFNLTGKGTEVVEIEVAKEDTVDQIISKINAKSGNTGIKASFFDGNNSIILTTETTGNSANIKIEGAPTSNNIGITNGSIQDEGFSNFSKGNDGQPVEVTVNGLKLNIKSNSFIFDGIKFDIKTVPVNGQAVIQTTNDTQGVFDSIKTFVDKYNEIIGEFNKKISEKKYRDYPPLLDDQKKEMKENDIKQWEEKAKSGILNSDTTISGFLGNLRNSLNEVVGGITGTGNPKTLSDIGITTSKTYQDNGKLVLDETKLKSALDSNLEEVKTLFTKSSEVGSYKDTTVTNETKHDESGFGWRIYDRINSTIANLASIAGSPTSAFDTSGIMAKQLKSINGNLDKEQYRLSRYENNLYKKFTNLETAMTKLNSQSSWLMQQLGIGY